MIYVKISDAPIPDGYTVTRTDHFTKNQFINEFKKSVRKAAQKWAEAHPKEVYTMDDVYQFRNENSPAYRRLSEKMASVYNPSNIPGSVFSFRMSKRFLSEED